MCVFLDLFIVLCTSIECIVVILYYSIFTLNNFGLYEQTMMFGKGSGMVFPEAPLPYRPELTPRFPEKKETLSLDDGFDQTPILKGK